MPEEFCKSLYRLLWFARLRSGRKCSPRRVKRRSRLGTGAQVNRRIDGGSWKRGQYGRQKGTSGVVAQWTLTSDARRSGCQLVALRQPQVSCGSGRCFHNPRSTRFSQEKSSFFSLLPSKAVGGLAGGPRDYSLGSQLAPAPCFSMGPLVPSTRGSVAPTGPAILAPSAGATDIPDP